MLLTYSARLALFPFKCWTDIHLHTCSYTCNNSAGMADVDTDVYTDPASFHFIIHVSLVFSQVLPEELASLSPPASEACADCLTAGVPGPLYRSPCPALCPLQLAVLAFCSPLCHLRTKAAGVSAKSLPSSQPTLPLTSVEWTHSCSLNLASFIFPSTSFTFHPPPYTCTQICVLYREVT